MGLLDYDIELAKNKLRSLLDAAPEYVNQLTQNVRNITGQNNAANLFAMRNLDAMAGGDIKQNVRQNVQEGRDKGMEMALNFNPGAVGMFIGKGAKTWDAVAAAEAEKRLAAGDDARKVWSELGVFRGPDGHLRQEIPDNKSFYRGSKAAGSSYADEVATHPELYKNYPSLGNIRISEFDGTGGSINDAATSMNVGMRDGNQTAIHELQHAIQQREGWAKGGSPEQMVDDYLKDKARIPDLEFKITREQNRAGDAARYADSKLKQEAEDWASKQGDWYQAVPQEEKIKDYLLQSDPLYNAWYKEHSDLKYGIGNLEPHDRYKRLAGEAEARATQARMNMDMAQRRATFPLDSYDVPVNQLIIRGLLGE